MVRRVSPGPRIDVFSREIREGFDQYGNEAESLKRISYEDNTSASN
jgi:N6-adenosine-specific RNA methylase IME4